MNFGVIGYGNIAKKFVKSIENTSNGIIYAIASHSISKDDLYLKEHPNVIIYNDYNSLLEDKNIEAVYIAIPHIFHKNWIIEALKKNKYVLCEKPLVLNSNDYQEIIKYNHSYLLEAFKTKFNDGFIALKKDLKLIGDIQSIYANFCFDGTIKSDSYLFDKRQGGALNDVGSYIIGFIINIVDSKVDSISSEIEFHDEIDLNFKVNLRFKNGIEGIGEGAINYNKERYALIKGSKGEIYIPNYNRIIDYIIKLDNQEITRHYPIIGDDMTKEIQALIDDVKLHKKESTIHSLLDSYNLQILIEQIREAGK